MLRLSRAFAGMSLISDGFVCQLCRLLIIRVLKFNLNCLLGYVTITLFVSPVEHH